VNSSKSTFQQSGFLHFVFSLQLVKKKMKKINREAFRFLFKLFILIHLYSYLKSTTEAAKINHIKENVGQSDQTDGINLNDRMSQIEAKSRRQENDISFLKAIIVEDKRTIRQLRGRVSSLESFLLTTNPETNDQLLLRQKRPYRLLPAIHSREYINFNLFAFIMCYEPTKRKTYASHLPNFEI